MILRTPQQLDSLTPTSTPKEDASQSSPVSTSTKPAPLSNPHAQDKMDAATKPPPSSSSLQSLPTPPPPSAYSKYMDWVLPTAKQGATLASKAALYGTKWYHNYKVKGLENIPKTGPVLLVLTHSLATYDVVLLLDEIAEKTGRTPKPLVDRLFFKIPGISELAHHAGMIEGNRDNARELLNAGELVVVLPGGMKEALKPSSEKYDIKWDTRKGFVKMALETGAQVVMGACPAADDLYTVYGNPLTRTVYDTLKAPLPIFAGRYYTAMPMASELTHVLSKPVQMPQLPNSKHLTQQFVDGKHRQLIKVMDSAITQALSEKK